LKGVSPFHVLDEFSINLSIEYRTVQTNDPAWPNIVVSGNLPQLFVHLNEDKVCAIERVTQMLLGQATLASGPSRATSTVEPPHLLTVPEEEAGAEPISLFSDWSLAPEVDQAAKLVLLQFSVSELSTSLQLQGKSIAELRVSDVQASLTKRPFDFGVEVSVRSLLLLDLQVDERSKHRQIMTSLAGGGGAKDRTSELPSQSCLSSSCPDLYFHESEVPLSTSLPQRLNTELIFGMLDADFATRMPKKPSRMKWQRSTMCRIAKAPSDTIFGQEADEEEEDANDERNLIRIKMLVVDESSPNFEVHRIVKVDFNTLDIVFNLETWVIVFDFFGIGAAAPKRSSSRLGGSSSEALNAHRSESSATKEHQSTEIDAKVVSLSVILNRYDYEVASATVGNFSAKISLREGNFAIDGELGNFSLKDLTSHGLLYKDRFMSRGENVLTFHLFKHGASDPDLKRPHDVLLRLRMASIIYVHTHRFYTELLSFFVQFHQLQSIMNFIRESAAVATKYGGGGLNEVVFRGVRVRLDVEAGSPMLVMPMSSLSRQILVADLGCLQVCNTFKFCGDEGTISVETLASTMARDLLSRRSRAAGSSRSSLRSRSTVRSPGAKTTKTGGAASAKSQKLNVPDQHPESARKRRTTISSNKSRKTATVASDMEEEDEEEDFVGELQSEKVKCLLDVLSVSLKAMDLRTAEWLSAFTDDNQLSVNDIMVGNFVLRIHPQPLLKEKCELKLQVERNLDKAFCHRVPDISVKGVLSRLHAAVDSSQYVLIRGLLAYNLGEPLDDLEVQVLTNEYLRPDLGAEEDAVWTGMYMDFELEDVTVDVVLQRHGQGHELALARINLFKSRLVYESFSDGTKDVDLVSQEILLSDLRFDDFPVNKRANVFTQILLPMPLAERSSPLQAEVHYRATRDTNRFTIVLNNMRVMAIFDWWLSALDFISKAPVCPSAQRRDSEGSSSDATPMRVLVGHEEPIYPSAGIISRRAPVVESSGPVFELKLNITDSEVIVVADASQLDSSTVILKSTSVIAFRPSMTEHPFSCNLNNAEVFSCILGKEEDSSLSIIDPVTINIEIGGRSTGASASKGLLDLMLNDQSMVRTAEIQLQQLNVRLSYHDWLMFRAILDSFPGQIRDAIYGRSEEKARESRPEASLITEDASSVPTNVKAQIVQLMSLGFNRADCTTALNTCDGQLEEAALWLTQNASPARSTSPDGSEQPTGAAASEAVFLSGTPVSFATLEFKSSAIALCIIDDCKDADIPLLELGLSHLGLKHSISGEGEAATTLSGNYYNRALSCWEPFMEPWRCQLDWRFRPVGNLGGQKLSVNLNTNDLVNFNITSTFVKLYQTVKTNWTEDFYRDQQEDAERYFDLGGGRRRRAPFVPFEIDNRTGTRMWFCTQTQTTVSGPQFGAGQQGGGRARPHSGAERRWQLVQAGETVQFAFEDRGKMRHMNSQEITVHQLIVRVDGWQEVDPVSVDRVGTYFRSAASLTSTLDAHQQMPAARIVFDVNLEGSARKKVTVRSALLMSNKLPVPVDVMLQNTALKLGGSCLSSMIMTVWNCSFNSNVSELELINNWPCSK
jgi:vacuolar protein sorting-associated protein 13D